MTAWWRRRAVPELDLDLPDERSVWLMNAADRAVERRDWAASDHQTEPLQDEPIRRSVMHRDPRPTS